MPIGSQLLALLTVGGLAPAAYEQQHTQPGQEQRRTDRAHEGQIHISRRDRRLRLCDDGGRPAHRRGNAPAYKDHPMHNLQALRKSFNGQQRR